MKRYNYTVTGLDGEEKRALLLDALVSVIPDAVEVECDFERSRLSFSANIESENREAVEADLAEALSLRGFELILPEGVNTYSYVGDKPKQIKMIPLSVALSIIAAVMAITMLFCYATFDLVDKSGDSIIQQPSTEETDAPIPEYIEDLVKLDEIFKANSYDGIDEEAMGSAILKAYIEATGDVYAEYMTKDEYDDYTSDSRGDFVGVGVSIVNSTIEINGYNYKVLEIISVFENSPALESGVQVGDCIMYVGGGEEKVLVDEIGHAEALDRMLGKAGTEAKFTVFRPDKTAETGYREMLFSIVRRKVTTESVKFKASETDARVGIVKISSFDMTTAPQLTNAIDTLREGGCEYFVFDLRNNPGGALASIEAVLSYFLDKGDLIVSTEYANGEKHENKVRVVNYGKNYAGYNVTKNDIGKYKDLRGKCVVLTNGNTASAAELFTATFRDYEMAPIVGETTYGKGCMQNIINLKKYDLEGALRVTTAMYFSASHRVYHNIGIVPDYEVKLSEEAMKYNFHLLPESLDDQLQKGIELLLK